MFQNSLYAVKRAIVYNSRTFLKCVPFRSNHTCIFNSLPYKSVQAQSSYCIGSNIYRLSGSVYSCRNIHAVHMRGLDWEAAEQDVIDFFKPLNIKPSKISLRCDISGRTGLCEVEFATHAEAVVAMRKRHAFIGNRFIRLSLKSDPDSSAKSSENSVDANDDIQSEKSTEDIENESTLKKNVIRMKNLSTRMTEQAIFQFFWPLQVTPTSVKPVHDDNGYRTGEFDVEFLTNDDAMRAMTKNNTLLGHRYVELVLLESNTSSIPTSPEYHKAAANSSYSNDFGQNYSRL